VGRNLYAKHNCFGHIDVLGGALADRFRVRALAWIVMPALALVCLAMAANTTIVGLIVIVFLLRFFLGRE